ncbi:MAG: type II secretion system protein [bacterium]|nr:type II secretion system protein [bacterium]MDY4101066.1 type II secretion system protein [Lachnospiraceae bacterium]
MIQKMKQWKKKDNNKGFTLVELIVVLVILAILAAILVPALLGYIDRAKQQQIVLNAKSCYTAAQAEMSSMYAKNVSPSAISSDPYKKNIIDTADVPNCTALSVGTAKSATDHAAYTVTYIAYSETTGGKTKTIYFDGTSWVETAPLTSNYTIYPVKSGS